jgi:hypothetical protein
LVLEARHGKLAITLVDMSCKKTFTPPSSGIDNDWVLVLEDATKFEKMPGVIEK